MAGQNHIRDMARSVLTVMLLAAATGITTAKPDPGIPIGSARSVGMSAERLGRIGPAMQRYIDDELVPGTVTLVARRGKVVHFEARGSMDVEGKKPMRKDAVFRIASMTKPITSVALMILWEEGKFQLRDPVSKFIPEFANQKVSTTADASGNTGELVDAKREATIRDMLTHTAGLANSYIGNGEYYREQMQRRPDDTLAKLMTRLAALPLNYQPGEAWQYSTATTVVGRLVEVMSGQTLAEFMQERIFRPLKMPDTHFYLADDKGGRLTSQYTPGEDSNKIVLQDPGSNESRWVTAENKSVFSGSGGLVSTPHDYMRFQSAMLNCGELDGVRLLSPSTLSLMMANHTDDIPIWLAGPGMGFGLGWGVVVDRGRAATPLSEGSVYWGGAYCTISWIDPEQELVGILMTQVRPYGHINIRQDFQVLVHQAIID
ncbi:MAG: serine hydrolase domain-containing protein [Pseudomonadales bacterium]|jgi:CubicO group peptidase (beta-lactamase class C family)|nr:serine hydrolase domain-containing protein [Pseudomonadales bacterium]MDP7596599.1 serine hydrolase domain-containing protein [Pseudomonadales bacterium]HJN53397.1 serine hydrolase domain-containing protein [Pseudomonadales bacterium]